MRGALLISLKKRASTLCARSGETTAGWSHAKPPFAGPRVVLKYLARYTNRVAIGNSRLVSFEHGRVSFRYKDNARGGEQRIMTLDGTEFLRRFLMHVLPSGFMSIRHYGLLANCCRTKKLTVCRDLLAKACIEIEPEPVTTDTNNDTDSQHGTTCQGAMRPGPPSVPWRRPLTFGLCNAPHRSGGVCHLLGWWRQSTGVVGRSVPKNVVRESQNVSGGGHYGDLASTARRMDSLGDSFQWN